MNLFKRTLLALFLIPALTQAATPIKVVIVSMFKIGEDTGDIPKEIDSREIPEDWPYGYLALGAKRPNTLDDGWQVEQIKFQLNEGLVEWAYDLTKDFPLQDDEALARFREIYAGYPNAIKPPIYSQKKLPQPSSPIGIPMLM